MSGGDGGERDDLKCERVSDQQYLDGVRIKPHCALHGCDWPDDGECPIAEDERSNKLSNAQDAIPWNLASGEYK